MSSTLDRPHASAAPTATEAVMAALPRDHPQRSRLSDEVHARPPEALRAPLRVSYVALVSDWSQRELERRRVGELAVQFRATPPEAGATHFSADLGPFRLKWERHTEFARYKVIVAEAGSDAFAEPAIRALPAGWLQTLPGEVMVAAHAALLKAGRSALDYNAVAQRSFAGNTLIGSQIAGGGAEALTDMRIHHDGFSRFLVADRGMSPRQAGRMIQRLLEIETYRMLALLALPVARDLMPALTGYERELARLTAALAKAGPADEPVMLDGLTRLDAELERQASANHYRFSAAAAYYELVQRRIAELRESRIQGLQTFQEFTERRLAPAMSTCRAAEQRQAALSQRIARATQLLSTRVDISLERQNQAVLASMNRRAKLQLRLQETVEGLSVAALTYYVAGLVGYVAKGVAAAGYALDPDLAVGVSIPVVAVAVALGVRRLRKTVMRTES